MCKLNSKDRNNVMIFFFVVFTSIILHYITGQLDEGRRLLQFPHLVIQPSLFTFQPVRHSTLSSYINEPYL